MIDLGPAEHFATGALGPPGARTFYLQVGAGGVVHSFLLEKAQVAVLAQKSIELLREASIVPDPMAVRRLRDSGLDITAPDRVEFRVGVIALHLSGRSELVTVTVSPGEEEDEEPVSFVVAPEQLQAAAIRGAEVVAAGRPICPKCRLPQDPGGHQCPSTNGHRPAD
jgi:uncharacterized repeat protein (TIGR03847 family)